MILGLFHSVMEVRAQGSRERQMESMGQTKSPRLQPSAAVGPPVVGGAGSHDI